MTTPYRTSPEPLPASTPVPWRCRWFEHTFGPMIPVPESGPLVLLQKCGHSRCRKWQRVDIHGTYPRVKAEWRELHEVWPRRDPPTESTVSEYQESPR